MRPSHKWLTVCDSKVTQRYGFKITRVSPHELPRGKPGSANLLIGAWQNANQEIGVPGKYTIP